MKSLALVLMATTLLASPALHAATYQADQNGNAPYSSNTTTAGPTQAAWGIALVGLAVLGTVVGLVAANASTEQASFSH